MAKHTLKVLRRSPQDFKSMFDHFLTLQKRKKKFKRRKCELMFPDIH